jgi:hypothetical protein
MGRRGGWVDTLAPYLTQSRGKEDLYVTACKATSMLCTLKGRTNDDTALTRLVEGKDKGSRYRLSIHFAPPCNALLCLFR